MLGWNIRLPYYSGTYGIGQVDNLRSLSTEPQLSLSLSTELRFKEVILWCFSVRTYIPTGELDALNLNIRFYEGVPVDFKK
jgi:hypothetical protein